MRRAILLLGTPGVGKTRIGKALAERLRARYIDISEYVVSSKLYTRYDRKTSSYVIDEAKLKRKLRRDTSDWEEAVIGGHVVFNIGAAEVVGLVLRLDPKQLYRRLKRRNYSRRKAAENAAAEFIGTVYSDAVETLGRKRVKQLDCTGLTVRQATARCLSLLRGGKGQEVDWTRMDESELDELLRIISSSGKIY